MPYLIRLSVFCAVLLAIQAHASTTIYKVLEQDENGVATHRAFDRSAVGDGIDPVMQFIALDSPTNPSTAQVLWEASETAIPWNRTAEFASYRMVEFADLPDGGRLEYRIFEAESDEELLELRHVRATEKDGFAVDPSVINNLPDGVYDLHAHVLIPDRPTHILKQLIDVSDVAFDPALDQNTGLENKADVRLSVGSGWTGPTPTPAQIGDRHERAIAHWNVVPEQSISDGFTVGVIAHHLDGMDRVEISANNGPWVVIHEPSINPRTKSVEYWASLDIDGQAGAIKLRAIAYPKLGTPYVVKPLGKTYRERDLTLYSEPVGEVLELPAGKHNLKNRRLPETGWLTVRPAPGVAREDCILVGESENWGKGRLKLENLTLHMPAGNNTMRGEYDRDADGHYHGNHVWFENCRLIGNGPVDSTSYCTVMWETHTFTNCEISDVQIVFHSHGAINLLSRNNYIHNVYEDVYRSSGLMVGDVIENVDRQPLVEGKMLRGNDRPHPDIWQFQNMPNTIAQDITAVKNINAQGLFPKDVDSTAIVRCRIDTVSPYFAMQIMGDAQNFLVKDSAFAGCTFRGAVLPGERAVFDRVTEKGRLIDIPNLVGIEIRN